MARYFHIISILPFAALVLAMDVPMPSVSTLPGTSFSTSHASSAETVEVSALQTSKTASQFSVTNTVSSLEYGPTTKLYTTIPSKYPSTSIYSTKVTRTTYRWTTSTTSSSVQLPTTQTHLLANTLPSNTNHTIVSSPSRNITSSSSRISTSESVHATIPSPLIPTSTLSGIPIQNHKSGDSPSDPPHGVVVALITFAFLAGSIVLVFLWSKYKDSERFKSGMRLGSSDSSIGESGPSATYTRTRIGGGRPYTGNVHLSISQPFCTWSRTI